ncbi:MAG TPA: peptidase domain-containing ABC transporter [Burkholderiaceae bacterium]
MNAALDRLRLGWFAPRLPLVLQTEAAECGLACLAMVAAHHGLRTDLPTLRQRFALSLKGSTLADLVRMAGALQLNGRALRLEPDQLAQLQLPCVLHWDLNHFVVLREVGAGGVVIHDPALGVRRLALGEAARHFTGVALELLPAADFAPRSERRRLRLRQLVGRVAGLRRALARIVVLALALEFFVLLAPFFLQWVVDGVLVSADRDLLATLGVGFALLVLLQAATAAIRSWAVLVLSCTLNLQWLGNVFAHLLRLPVDWFEKRHQGDVLSRFGAVRRIQETLTTSFVEALLDGLMVVATLAMMALYSPLLSAIALGAVALYGLLRWAFFAPLREATAEAIVHDAKTASHFLESLRGVQAIKLFARQHDRRSRYLNLVVDAMNADIATRRLGIAFATGQRLLVGIERVAVIWVGALLVLDSHGFTVGMLFAFIAYQEQFAQRVTALIDKAVELKMLGLQGERLADIVLAAPEADASPRSGAPPAARIELRGLAFRYADGEARVIDGLDLTVEPGESVAIVGPSGCGKTTLLKLMLGIHRPEAGEIAIGGVPLARLGLEAWRSMIGTVMQDDMLFAGSIADNIVFFDSAPDLERARECARVAAVHEEIEALPMGYDTLIGDMGASLSGGQKQRILLARALYKRPQVLFLDEATSALDIERERQVNQAIRQLALTRIVVAHRPETIASASRVVVLAGGRVAQDLRSVAGPVAA